MPVCEKCNFEMPQDSMFCGKCGNKLMVAAKKRCSCGNEESADLFFCENCGKLLPETSSSATSAQASSEQNNANYTKSASAGFPIQSPKPMETYSPPTNPFANIDVNGQERELLRISVVTLPSGGLNFTIGTFVITTKSVLFEPVWGDKKIIPVRQIAAVDRVTHNITAPAIEISEKNNQKTIFVFIMPTYADNAAKTLSNLLAIYPK